MQASMKTYFRRLAEGNENGAASHFLLPVLEAASKAYGAGVCSVRKLYEKKILKSSRLPFPVVSVGNLSWGGTGKTPLVEYLAKKIADRQKTPLVLTRGYSHDEVLQFKHHIPNALIGVGKNRVEVARQTAEKHPVDVAILDDGLQHWPVERDLEIVTINALNPFGNGKLIPRGILREPVSALKRASLAAISHVNLVTRPELDKIKEMIAAEAPGIAMLETYLEPLFFYRAKSRDRLLMSRLENQKVTTFSAIGAPRSFQQLLSQNQVKPVRNFEFTDHHVFTEKELQEIKSVSENASITDIVTTEKDFYRSPELITKVLNPLVLATRLRVRFGEDQLMERLWRLIESRNK